MDSSSLSKPHFYFLCTNYGCSKDGIGHYTSKIVDELKKINLSRCRYIVEKPII